MKTVIAALMTLSCGGAIAQSVQPLSTGNDFLNLMELMDRPSSGTAHPIDVQNHTSVIRMLGVVQGMRDANVAIRAINKVTGVTTAAVACVPDGVTTGQLVRVLKAELEKDPKNLYSPFPILSQFALIRVYPCTDK